MSAHARIACLLVPALPLHAVLRATPALRGQPLAVLARGVVQHASPEAVGVRPGLSGPQAQALCAGLHLCTPTAATLATAEEALLAVAAGFSPILERGPDLVQLAVGDLRLLYPEEAALAAALQARAAEQGLPARVAVASSVGVARVLARARPGITVAAPGQEAALLAPLPVAALGLTPPQAEALAQWGVRTVGDFAALPRRTLAARLGAEGTRLHRLAHGEDPRPLIPMERAEPLCEALELDAELADLTNLETLAFLLRGLLDRLLERLARRALACGDYQIHLKLADGSREERAIAVATPTRDAAALLTLARLQLQANPPRAPLRGVAVQTTPARVVVEQLALLAPPGPRPPPLARLMTALAQLKALCGEDGVGVPQLLGGHAPGRAARAGFPMAPLALERSDARDEGPRPQPLTAHTLRPPQAAEVLPGQDGAPRAVRLAGQGSDVVHAAGPYRLRGALGVRDYYDVELGGGILLRLFRESDGAWFLDARYA